MDRKKGVGDFNLLFKDRNNKMDESIRTNRMIYLYILELVNNLLFDNTQAKQDDMHIISERVELYANVMEVTQGTIKL